MFSALLYSAYDRNVKQMLMGTLSETIDCFRNKSKIGEANEIDQEALQILVSALFRFIECMDGFSISIELFD
jgi:hypothetical protein